jgi:hypothetical protein
LSSLPGQNGQAYVALAWVLVVKCVGRRLRSVEMITQRPTTGSFLNSGMSFLVLM